MMPSDKHNLKLHKTISLLTSNFYGEGGHAQLSPDTIFYSVIEFHYKKLRIKCKEKSGILQTLIITKESEDYIVT